MENYSTPPQKKGLSTGAKIGIGCGGLALLIVIGMIVAGFMLGGKLMQIGEESQKNPARAAATSMVSLSFGAIEMVAEDDVNKRYTVKVAKTGALTTIYWSEKTKTAEIIAGDFSAIPSETEVLPDPDAVPTP